MKRIFLAVLALGLSLTVYGQRSDGERIGVSYLILPEVPFQPEITSTQATVEIPYGLSSFEDREAIVKNLTTAMEIDGYESVPEDGQIQVKAIYYGFSTHSPEYVKEAVEEKRDKKMVKVTYHYYKIDYKLPVKLQVSLNGEILDEFYVENSADLSVYKTAKYSNYKALSDYWGSNKNKILKEIKTKALASRTSSISSFLDQKYGYRKNYVTEKLYTFKTKKHNYEDYDRAMALAKEAFELYSDSLIYPVDDFVVKISEAINIWNNALEESDLEDRKARVNEKITGLTLQNLAFSYIWLFDFENARRCIEAGKELDKGDGWVKNYEGILEEKEAKLAKYEEAMNAAPVN